MDVNIIPTTATHQSSLRVMKRKNGPYFVGKFAKAPVKSWIQEFQMKIRQYKPDVAWDCPVHAHIEFKFPWNKSAPKKFINNDGWKTTRPDLDNMEKMILDSLTSEGFLVDDSIICSKTTMKMHSPSPKILIILRKIA